MNANNEKLNRFISLLKGIFELDKTDLDFGIYRIMNIRKDEISHFLSVELPKKVKEAIASFAVDTEAVMARITEIETQAHDLEIEISASPKLSVEYNRLKELLARGTDMSGMETDVYSALYNFFNRYYDEGDFISKRRYKEGVYAIPYEGEEVKLYWANSDQYYIKTAENFRDYTFVVEGKKVHFRLVDATTERDNNKEANGNKRVFMLYNGKADKADAPACTGEPFAKRTASPEVKTIEEEDDTLIIRFIYDIPADKKKQEKYTAESLETIMETLEASHPDWWERLIMHSVPDKPDSRTILDKHLTAYVAKNTFDYFIHKDLHGFLTRELDFFIKSEVIHLEDIDTTDEKRVDTYLAKVRAIKRVGKIIIEFLAQIENFQKKLWLKKKFVVATNWCITLDHVDETFYPEIIANAAQIDEWVDMYAIDEITGDATTAGYSAPLTGDFLRQNVNLVLDTKHFTADFKDRLVASIDNLDEQTSGMMVHSENFQALGFLRERYREKIKSVYIDPPYNTDASEILYKNTYKHSSWLSLMESRLKVARNLMSDDAMICVTIDDYEKNYAALLIQDVFGAENSQGIVPIRNNPQGRSTVKGFSINHEYAIFSGNSEKLKSVGRLDHTAKQKERYSEQDKDGNAFLWENFRKTGTDSNRADRPKQYYAFFVDPSKLTYRIPEMAWNSTTGGWVLTEQPQQGEQIIYPKTDTGEEKVWKWGIDRVRTSPEQIKVERNGSGIQLYRMNYYNDEGSLPNTWWDDAKYAAGSHGTNLLTDIFGVNRVFIFPKSVYAVMDCLKVLNATESETILDYFAGSGTTGHAVINLNRDDGGERKYILIEMGEYFNAVTLPRMKKVIYSANWKKGKPQNRNTGVSHIMKYLVLESYEDTLLNIELSEDFHRLMVFLGEEYMLRYMFDAESKNSILQLEAFNVPFSYSLKVSENNETKEKIVDLCETFNYLMGISVMRQSAPVSFNAIAIPVSHDTDGAETPNASTAFFATGSIDVKRNCYTPDPEGEYENAVRLEQAKGGEFTFRSIQGRLPDGKTALIIWRNITKDILRSNAALDAYFIKNHKNLLDREFDMIFVNGDNNLENLRLDNETWKVQRIEPVFKEKMFEGAS